MKREWVNSEKFKWGQGLISLYLCLRRYLVHWLGENGFPEAIVEIDSFIRRVLQHFGWERIVVWVKLLTLEKEMDRFILRTELIRPLMKKKAHAGQYSLFSFS